MHAPVALTNPLGAVIATNPANNPLPLIDASGLPLNIHMYSIAPNVPRQPANIVSTATEPIRRLPLAEAPSVLPGLNPNQPKARMKHPISTAEMSWPRIALEEPSRLNFPMRGPTISATASAVKPADRVHHARTRKIAIALPQAQHWFQAVRANRHPKPS